MRSPLVKTRQLKIGPLDVILATTPLRLALIVGVALALSLTVFAPRLWLLRSPAPGTFQWDRGTTYLRQCEAPFRRDIEPAMRWRLLPPLVAKACGLTGQAPLILPWIGVIAATAYVAILFRRRLNDVRWVFGGTLLFASTSAVLVPCHWLGLNDGWIWLGLLAVAFGSAPWALPAACLLCPWIDERFIIAFPLAWVVSRSDRGEAWFSSRLRQGLWLVPYAATRLILSGQEPEATTANFLTTTLPASVSWLPMAPLAWWMGLRAAWLPVAYAGATTHPRLRLIGFLALGSTLLVNAVLAVDLSRSVAAICPVLLLGCWAYARDNPATAPRRLLLLALANLLVPAAHVVHAKIDVIQPLPIEIIRLFYLPA
ncbi:MAG: hypothetical protein H7343_02445 [Undibacterium sp.]|nr:hypothetical protein [Opitutaceae bacterium]